MSFSLTLINHASLLLRLGDASILTDPTYAWSVGIVAPRMQKPGIPFDELPPIDLILISHNDYDHLHLRTLRRLRRRRQSTVIVPAGDRKYARRAGFNDVREMTWWNTETAGAVRVTAVPARHKTRRLPFQRSKDLCCGYVVEANGSAVYFAGDTGYGDHFAEIGARFRLQAALLPIGAYKPHDWFRDVHLNPKTAMQAFLDLKAEMLVPMHWGTFKISDEPLDEPPQWLMEEADHAGVAERVRVLRNGEKVEWGIGGNQIKSRPLPPDQ